MHEMSPRKQSFKTTLNWNYFAIIKKYIVITITFIQKHMGTMRMFNQFNFKLINSLVYTFAIFILTLCELQMLLELLFV